MTDTPTIVLSGQYGSPYTLKMRGVLRYRHDLRVMSSRKAMSADAISYRKVPLSRGYAILL